MSLINAPNLHKIINFTSCCIMSHVDSKVKGINNICMFVVNRYVYWLNLFIYGLFLPSLV
jgi:hypothetical protein